MKKLSILIMSSTLVFFYLIADFQQEIWVEKNQTNISTESGYIDTCPYIKESLSNSKFTHSIKSFTPDFKKVVNDDSFDTRVTGKEHRYLNRGFNCEEFCFENPEIVHDEIVQVSKRNFTDLSGS